MIDSWKDANRAVVLAKIETEYGVDSGPEAALNAILTTKPIVKPIFDRVARNFVTPTLSPLADKVAGASIEVTFDVEARCPDDPGEPPEISPLLRASGMAETITPGVSVEYSPVSKDRESCTIYVYLDGILHKIRGCRVSWKYVGDVNKYGIWSFTVRGMYANPVDEAMVDPAYVEKLPEIIAGATVQTLARPGIVSGFPALAVGSTATNVAHGAVAIKIGGTAYSIAANAVGVALGAVSYTIPQNKWGVFAFQAGSDLAVDCVAAPGNEEGGYATAKAAQDALPATPSNHVRLGSVTVKSSNAGGFVVGATSLDDASVTAFFGNGEVWHPVINKFELDIANSFFRRDDITQAEGWREIVIESRKPAGSIDPEAVSVAKQNLWRYFKEGIPSKLTFGSGLAGQDSRIAFIVPRAIYSDISYGERGPIRAFSLPFACERTAGDDELSILFE